MRTKTKIIILAMLEGKKTCWNVKVKLLSAYFQSENQDNEVKDAIARYYAQNITKYIARNAEEKVDDISEELNNFFYHSIYHRKVTKEFYYKILRDSNLHDGGVRQFISIGFYLDRASFEEMLKDKPGFVISQAKKKHEKEKDNLYEYVSKNPKIFSNLHSPDFRNRVRQGLFLALALTALVYVICDGADISSIRTMISCLITFFIGKTIPHLPQIYSVRQSSINAVVKNLNLSLKLRNDHYFDNSHVHEPQKRSSLSADQKPSFQASPQPILILESISNNQVKETENSVPAITSVTTIKRKYKTPDEPASEERNNQVAQNAKEPLTPALFGDEFSYLKPKHIIKVEGQGAGLGPQSQRYSIWHRRSIKESIKPRDQDNYAYLKELFSQVGTATPHGQFGLKYISIFNIYELKGKGKARVYSDGNEKRNEEKSAIVLAHYIRNGFH